MNVGDAGRRSKFRNSPLSRRADCRAMKAIHVSASIKGNDRFPAGKSAGIADWMLVTAQKQDLPSCSQFEHPRVTPLAQPEDIRHHRGHRKGLRPEEGGSLDHEWLPWPQRGGSWKAQSRNPEQGDGTETHAGSAMVEGMGTGTGNYRMGMKSTLPPRR